MGSSQQFSLKWTNYTNHITNAFDSLRSKEDFCDVTLSCEGRKIRAHKVLLSACSTYFKEIFKENPCQHPVIIFKNVKYDDLLSIVVYMYQGEVNIEQEALPTFLHTAEMLSIQGLTEDDSAPPEKNIIAVQTPPVQQQTHVAAAHTTHAPPQNTITIHGQAITKTIRDSAHLNAPKFTLSKPISIIGAAPNSTPVDQIVYTTVTQAPTTLMQADVIPAKRKRKLVTQTPQEKPQTFVTQKAAMQTISAEPVEQEPFMKTEIETEMTTEYAEDDDKDYHSDGGDGDMGTFETGSHDNDNDDKNDDDDFNKPKMATPAELGRLFSSGGTPTPDSKRSTQGTGATDGSTSKWSQCQYCKLVITTVNLWRHIRTQHTANAPRACEFCSKKFKNKYSLREHVRIAHEQKPGTESSQTGALRCRICNRIFTSIAARRRHIASRHSQIKQLTTCTFEGCSKEFKTKWSLATHVSRFHR